MGRNSCWGRFLVHISYAVLTAAPDNSYNKLQIFRCCMFSSRPCSRIPLIDGDQGKKKRTKWGANGCSQSLWSHSHENGVFQGSSSRQQTKGMGISKQTNNLRNLRLVSQIQRPTQYQNFWIWQVATIREGKIKICVTPSGCFQTASCLGKIIPLGLLSFLVMLEIILLLSGKNWVFLFLCPTASHPRSRLTAAGSPHPTSTGSATSKC